MFDVVNGHLRKLARRALNDRWKRGEPWARKSELAEALAEYVRAECRAVIFFQDYGEPRAPARERRMYLDGDRAVDAVARSAATYVLDRWTPAYIRDQQQRGRTGGENGKRPPEYTDADLDALAALSHLPNMQARADAMGRKLRTVERMAKTLRQRAEN